MTLRDRASTWGVRTSYQNFRKQERKPPAASIEAILDAMEASGAPPPPSTLVVTQGDTVPTGGFVEIATEDGGRERLRAGLPADLPPGYHRLIARDGAERELIVGPPACFLPDDLHIWGWAIQLYSLRSRSSWGIGDLADLERFGKWAADCGAGAVMVNPLHAPLPLPTQQASPYFPSSRCFRNPLYLDIDRIPGNGKPEGLDGLAARARALSGSSTIDRDAVYALKLEALELLWRAETPPPAFEAFWAARGEVERYAIFASLAEHFGGGPSRWPAGYEDPASPAVHGWARANHERVRFHAWVQWLLEQQLEDASKHTGIVHDLAIGVDPDGADAWVWHDSFAEGVSIGAPPDEFNLRGQDWGLPPFDPWKLRANGYRPFIETIRASLRHAAGLRIDHVMGLFRLYWIPRGAAPDEGTYVAYPYEDLLTIVALESVRAGAFIVGEDLGTVEDVVREEMYARNMLSYRLLWFEDDVPSRYPARALAAIANHDVPTIAGLWSGKDVESQSAAGLEVNEEGLEAQLERLRNWLGLDASAPVEEVIEGAYRLLATAPSAVIMATLEDALGVEERPNLPGTTDERPNWSIPLPLTIEEIPSHPTIARICELLTKARDIEREEPAPAEDGERTGKPAS
ncbi:MAG TPA: 4-alpha-glucanotransferase [Actinomycetota bacterium]|nr:4-alpha-glucanotransferase [Actinomycetota bacterium]